MRDFLLFGEIDEMNTTEAINFLAANEGDVTITIDSVGGDVFAGLRLCQAIANHTGKVTAKCGVVVASIASVIALACDEMVITKDTFFMVHQAWAVASGTAEELMSTATLLEQASNRIKEIIADKAVNMEDADGWMAKDTWFGYQAIIDSFKCVSLVEEEQKPDAKAVASYAKLANKPEALLSLVAKLQNEIQEDEKEQDDESNKDEEEKPKDESEEEKQEDEEAVKNKAYIESVLAKAESVLKG